MEQAAKPGTEEGLAATPSPLPMQVVNRGAEAIRPAGRGRRLLWILPLVGALAALAVLLLHPTPPAGTSLALRLPEGNVTVPAPADAILGLGKLLPRSRILTVAAPFGAGDARIAELRVREGERVEGGEILALLDSASSLRATVAVAEANLAARGAAMTQTGLVVATAVASARAILARAEATEANAGRDLARAAELNVRGVAADQVLDQRRLAHEQAVQDVARARADLTRYGFDELDRQADMTLARAKLEAARAELERARADFDRALVRAPGPGTVLTIAARPGERPVTDGVLTFGDLADMIAEVEVYETEVGALTPGMPATLTARALPRSLQGRVARIGQEVRRQTLVDASPAANTDTRVVRVVVDLDPASIEVAARFANLQVTASFATRERR
jgi:HlyD family secretion protein